MLKSKSHIHDLTCSFCSKIFQDPIELPCSHSLCKQHLAETNVLKQKRIKCIECKQDFQVKDNDFKLNNFLKKLLDEHDYLSDEEFSLKKRSKTRFKHSFKFMKNSV